MRRPLSRRYSVMPSMLTTFCGAAAGAAAGARQARAAASRLASASGWWKAGRVMLVAPNPDKEKRGLVCGEATPSS